MADGIAIFVSAWRFGLGWNRFWGRTVQYVPRLVEGAAHGLLAFLYGNLLLGSLASAHKIGGILCGCHLVTICTGWAVGYIIVLYCNQGR